MAEGLQTLDEEEPPPAEEPTRQPGATTDAYLDLYKLAVEMAARVSARRGTANRFFLTLNSALVAGIGLARPLVDASPPDRFGIVVLVLAGLVLTGLWWVLLRSYK